MLRRFRSVLYAAAVVFAAPPLAAQLPSPEILPPPRPVEEMTLPNPRYLEHSPQYFAPDLSFPLPRELASQEITPKPREADGETTRLPLPTSRYVGHPPQYYAPDRPTPPADRPVGVWVREVGPAKVVLTFTADRLTATARVWEDEKAFTVVLDADYVVMKDGTLVGLVTGFDADEPEVATTLQFIAGHPFALRWRADADTLSVRDVKCLTAGMKADADDEITSAVASVAGRYARMDDAKRKEWEKKAPAARADRCPPPRAATGPYIVPPVALPPPPFPGSPVVRTVQTLPDGRTVERIGVDFNAPPPPPTCLPVAGPLPLPCPPAGLPAYTLPPPPANLPVLPAGFYAPPIPAAMVTPAVAGPPLGTWTRDVGGFTVTLKVTLNQIVARLNFDPAGDRDGRELTFTADYSVSADGRRITGTFTGADGRTAPHATAAQTDEALKLPRELDGQPLAFEFRAADGVLSIRDVRAGTDGHTDRLRMLAGVYTLQADTAAAGWNAPRMESKYSHGNDSRTPVLPPQADAGPPTPVGLPTSTGPGFKDPAAMLRPSQEAAANPLVGTWVRERDGLQVVLRLAEKRVTLELNLAVAAGGAPGPAFRVHQKFDADCGYGPDGTVFGVFTGGDVNLEGFPGDAREALAEIRGELAKVPGNMFQFRVRVDNGALSLSSPQLGPLAGKGKPQDDPFTGRYERAAGPVPPPKPGSGAGCIVSQYSEDPNILTGPLLKQSEDLRPAESELNPNPIPKSK